MDPALAIINVLAGLMPDGPFFRPLKTEVVFQEKAPDGGYLVVADGSRQWSAVGSYTSAPANVVEGAQTITPVITVITPKTSVLVVTQVWSDGGRITVQAPDALVARLVKSARAIVDKTSDEDIYRLFPAAHSLAEIVRARVDALDAKAAKAEAKANAKALAAALAKARAVTGNEHTARKVAHLYM